MKIIFFIVSFFISYQLNAQKNQRKEAASVLNLIDSLTNTLGPPANELVAYYKEITTRKSINNNYQPQNDQIDSLRNYYDALISVYDNAIRKVTQNKTIEKFNKLKSNFITLLKKGKEPWAKVIPVQLKLFKEGWDSLSISEQDLITTTGSIFRNSAAKSLEWAKIFAEQEDQIEKKYHLELINNLYR